MCMYMCLARGDVVGEGVCVCEHLVWDLPILCKHGKCWTCVYVLVAVVWVVWVVWVV